jgi:DMSO/TMAO reductase YedYZ heme-binding membrane subunit
MTGETLWYVARAGGLIAWGLLAASVLWGVALSTRIFGRRPRPAWLLDLHRYLGGLGVIFVVVHVGAVMADTYVPFSAVATFVPFASSWHPAAVALGIVALYLLLSVELTSLFRSHLPLQIWRRVHYLSFAVFVLATVHGLSAGTDRNTAAMAITFLVVCGLVVLLVAVRVAPLERRRVTARTPRSRESRPVAAVRGRPPARVSTRPTGASATPRTRSMA